MFVKRNNQGKITAVSLQKDADFNEFLESETAELQEFLKSQISASSLEESDADFIRVLDDLINLLTEKRLIQFTDLPMAAQKKLLERESLRQSAKKLNLLSDEENETILL